MAIISGLKSLADKISEYPPAAYPQAFMCPSTNLQIQFQYSSAGRSRDVLPKLSLEIRASFELGRMLGGGEVISELETSWNELLDHGDEPFDLSFPPIGGVHPSLTLKATVVHARGIHLDSITGCKIARRTDAGHRIFAKYMRDEGASDLHNAVQHFQFVLGRHPVDHPDRAAALTNLAWARLQGLHSATPIVHCLFIISPKHWPGATTIKIPPLTSMNLPTSTMSYCHSAPKAPIFVASRQGKMVWITVISRYNNLPTDASNEGIQLRRSQCSSSVLWATNTVQEPSAGLHRQFKHALINTTVSMILKRAYNMVVKLFLCAPRDILTPSHFSPCFTHQGKFDDLNEAISLFKKALRLCPVGHQSREALLDSLGGALLYRFNRTPAVSLYRKALTLHPPGHPHCNTTLGNLATALTTRYGKLQASEDLDEAIDMCRESLRSTQLDHTERHITLRNLSSALCSRFTHTRKNEDVEEAITRYFSYMRLQEAYLSRYQMQHNPADLSLAVENFRLASRHPMQGFPDRIKEAINWARQAEVYQHESALEAYQTCLELCDNHAMTRSSIISWRDAATTFRGAQSLPVDAASCAIRCNDLQRAVELKEQGRGQQWSLASRLRTPLDDLESASLPLAHKLSEFSKRLSDAQGSVGSADRAAADQAAIEYRRLTEQWEAVVAEIRNLQGFSRFLLPPSYEDLQVAARHGPVIILIASQYSCNVIIVPTSGMPHHVPLPSVTLADLEMLKKDFAKVIRNTAGMGPKQPRTALIALLRKIWDEVMLPIVRVLQHDLKLPGRSRIWLCPTAAFTSIPLHAAHPFRPKADGNGRELCLEDIYICSYTPTLSALIRARQKMKTRVTPSFVAIGQGQPDAGQGEALLTVESELELVRSLVPTTANPITLSGDAATRAGALDALQHNTWVHLACHGKQDHAQPTILHKLNSHSYRRVILPSGDEKTPDEVIHLAAGLQFSGFKSVIGTLWVVDDAVAKHVVEAFYEHIFKDLEEGDVPDCTKAAWALNKATYAMRMKVPLEQRIVFVHIGV
ncbi:CHAT domain-containing protein [Suillus lakei]|nr:CHAT domain-containing protein [Suillus lakei]